MYSKTRYKSPRFKLLEISRWGTEKNTPRPAVEFEDVDSSIDDDSVWFAVAVEWPIVVEMTSCKPMIF
jgi:hypothetical protein